jgi:nuclear transport factor 2 (NTF2) superfamily protein
MLFHQLTDTTFTRETAIQKVPLAEDAWNSRDP